ncbi:MAG: MIP/aquaporin family protein [Solirubrobacterales bacterium]
MQDRGLAAYITELVGTFFLVFFIAGSVILYVATGAQAQFGSDFAVVGFAQGLVLFALIWTLGGVSGGHFNPAVTAAAAALRRIDPVDAVVYVLAQLSGGVLGALLAKGLLLDEGRAAKYGAATVSPLLGGNFQGFIVEGIGTFLLVLVVLSVLFNPRVRQEWGPLAIGFTLVFLIMIFGPLTGGAFNPARWFGPALVGEEFGDVWPYLGGELIGAMLAAGFFVLVIRPGEAGVGTTETVAERRTPGTT